MHSYLNMEKKRDPRQGLSTSVIMLRKVIVLSLICYARFVTSQQTAGGGLTGTDQSQGGVPNLGGGTFPASGIQTQTGSLTGLDTPGAQTGMDFTGTQTGVDPNAGQTGFDQTPFDASAQTGFGAAGHPTGFDQTSGGLDLTQGTGQNQQGLDQQGPIPADPLGGYPTDSPLYAVDILGGTGGTGAPSDPIVGGTLLGGANPVQTIELPHNEYTFNRIKDIETQFDKGIEIECPPADENDQSHVPETMVIKKPGDEQEVHANPEASIVPLGTSVGVCPPEDDEFPPSLAIPEPSIVPGEATSHKTEQEAVNEARKKFLEGEEYGGARLKYKGDKSACKMLDPRQSEFGEHLKIRGDEPFAQHQKGQDCSKEGDSEFQMVHQEQKQCELPSTSRGAVTPDDDQVKQTTRPPCAPEDDKAPLSKPVQETGDIAVPQDDDQFDQTMRVPYATEDSMYHEDCQSALTEPDLRNQIIKDQEQNTEVGHTTFSLMIVDFCSTPGRPDDHISCVEKLVSDPNTTFEKYLLFLRSSDKTILEKDEKGKTKSTLKTSIKGASIGPSTYCKKRYAPALVAGYLSNYEFDHPNSLIKIVTNRDTMNLLLPLINLNSYVFELWNDNLTTQRVSGPHSTQTILSCFPDIIKYEFDVYIDGDNCIELVKKILKDTTFTLKCLVFGNKQTIDVLLNLINETDNRIVLAPPSLFLPDAADCDIVKVVVHNYKSNPKQICIVSGDKIFKFIFKTNNIVTQSIPSIKMDVLVIDPKRRSPNNSRAPPQLLFIIYDK